MIEFHIYEEDAKTKKNTFLEAIEAGNILEAKRAYIKKTKWKPRRDVKLVARSPQMR
mgnify:CR=1 FL=1|tara:strand:- start:154 stop:324 length:171 start_codon:yes stop_codon:yes gene_type:complete